MSKDICLAQTISELKFILQEAKKDLICIPLNLEILLYCKLNNINYLDPKNYLDNNFHQKSLEFSDNFIKSVKFLDRIDYNIKIEFIAFLRFRLHSILFTNFLLDEIDKKESIKKIYISGWIQQKPKNLGDYFLFEIEDILKKKFKVNVLSRKIISENINNFYVYDINDKINKHKKNILFNNLGYNFKRFLFVKERAKYNFYFLTEDKIPLIKKIFFFILNVNPLILKVRLSKKNNSKIKYVFKEDKNFSFNSSLKKMMSSFDIYFHNLQQKNKTIKKFLSNDKVDLILTNVVRGFAGSLNEIGEKLNIPTVCITHGTIAPNFNNYDKIYKKIIAEAVFSGNSRYFAIQSKICQQSLKTHKVNGKEIISGNINFAQNKAHNIKQYAVYAVTLKDFSNSQFFGVEMFYEFNDNLRKLDDISGKDKIKIVVKVHPSQNHCIELLKKIYKNLMFSKKKIEILFKKSYATITFSSSVIEDSLNSKIPVILLDQWKRYVHCNAETNVCIKNKPVYYINKFSDLEKCLKNLRTESKINFSDYIYQDHYKKNISDNILSLIK